MSRNSNYSWLIKLSRKSSLQLSLAIGLSCASGLLLILQANLLAYIIDRAYLHGFNRVALTKPLFAFFGTFATRSLFNYLREIFSAKTATTIKASLREQLFKHILKHSAYLPLPFSSGKMSTAIIEQVESLHNFFAYYLPQITIAVFMPLAILVFVFPLNWVSALLLFISAPLIPLFMALIGMGAETLNKRHFKSLNRLSTHFLDTLQGLSTLKLFGCSKLQANVIAKNADEYANKTMSVLRIAFLSSGVLELFSSISIAIIAVYLGLSLLGQIHFGLNQPLSLQHALFILLLAPEFYFPLRQLAIHYHAKAEAIAAANDIQNIFSKKSFQNNVKKNKKITEKEIHIAFKHVIFQHSRNNAILDNINFSIHSQEKIAIIGASGCGKTTILKLILGLLTPTHGEIAINNINLNIINLDQWHSLVSWIGQHTPLIPTTVYENIRFAKPNASEKEIEQAIEFAAANEFIKKLPKGIHTQIGENHYGLSVGQAQRVALARAFLKDSPILLLDEPTASLDLATEQLILNSLSKLAENKTVIMASHRVDTISQAERIFMLKDAKLQEHILEKQILRNPEFAYE